MSKTEKVEVLIFSLLAAAIAVILIANTVLRFSCSRQADAIQTGFLKNQTDITALAEKALELSPDVTEYSFYLKDGSVYASDGTRDTKVGDAGFTDAYVRYLTFGRTPGFGMTVKNQDGERTVQLSCLLRQDWLDRLHLEYVYSADDAPPSDESFTRISEYWYSKEYITSVRSE